MEKAKEIPNVSFCLDPSEGDWPEDFGHENGNYFCNCTYCKKTFTGHKRRVVCKVCSKERGFTK